MPNNDGTRFVPSGLLSGVPGSTLAPRPMLRLARFLAPPIEWSGAPPRRFALLIALLVVLTGRAIAGPVSGKLVLPLPPKPPAVVAKGFLDRSENAKKPVQSPAVGPQLLVVLTGDAKPSPLTQVAWDLVGESFNRPVIGVPLGAEVMITNKSKTPRTLTAAEDPKLVPVGPINANVPKTFRVTELRSYTIGDHDAPHLKGKLVVVATPLIAYVEVTNNVGRFEFADVPDGSYKLRIFYRDNWIDRPEQTVTVKGKAKVELNDVKVPAGFPLRK